MIEKASAKDQKCFEILPSSSVLGSIYLYLFINYRKTSILLAYALSSCFSFIFYLHNIYSGFESKGSTALTANSG